MHKYEVQSNKNLKKDSSLYALTHVLEERPNSERL
jgi:hypothetical protein